MIEQENLAGWTAGHRRKEAGLISKEQLLDDLKSGQIDTVIFAFCDMQGRLMGKRLTAEYCLENQIDKGTHFCNYLLGTDFDMNTPPGFKAVNWAKGYGDWTAVPDWSTLRIVPWLDKSALVFCNVEDAGTGASVSVVPRNLLKSQLKRAEERGYSFMMASELEFYMFNEPFESIHEKGYQNMKLAGHYNEDYNLLQGTRNEPFYQKIRREMAACGLPVESSKGEAYSGQHEINLRYGQALTAADNHIMFKHGMKEIAIQDGLSVTFMAKPDHEWTGSSGHIHISLWDTDEENNLFYDSNEADDHMSQKMRSFLAGVLAYTRDFALFFAPHINSYKRFRTESWAPVNIAWSHDNRSAGYRIVGDKKSLRLETRIPGADVNPYLAYTALIASGLYGIEQGLELADECQGNAYELDVPKIPGSLYEAIQCFKESDMVKTVLGEDIYEHYLHAAVLEQQMYDGVVTEWERKRYFEQG
ncbi:glutamine synthetase [Scopulibacillus darangshiensis]|uniref:Glutamine synthetase n=1 Tax=Scopulibacillus darangshiensis TaxID=442528 RepID=A0A4R2P8F8_9BACL|nr:glutamine synthetase family protein [Scopulibacillus darangshiensis]TCP31239.1 glutamine synthetase [Scopulibacillus darangshiensis]